MELVLTPDETAAQLGLQITDTLQMFETGRLSGFRLGAEWRITPHALRADLERMGTQLVPPAPLPLGPRAESAFRVAPELRFPPPRLPERRDYSEVFAIRIVVENESDYQGEFAMYLTTEGSNDRWDVKHAHQCERVDSEMLIRDTVIEGEQVLLFAASLHGHIGDRLFLSIPSQSAVPDELDEVYVLQSDLALRLVLTNRGVFGRRRGVKIKEIPIEDAPELPAAD